MRDHRNLSVFKLADKLVIEVYERTRGFPREELFGLTSQMRRAAVSICTNIVEGCGRRTERELNRFLDIAFGSVREVGYLIDLSHRLGHLPKTEAHEMSDMQGQLAAALAAFIHTRRHR